jgi:glycine cleavage system aminomethyltransferase T
MEYAKEGTKVDLLYFEERYPATVTSEPLYDPDNRRLRA